MAQSKGTPRKVLIGAAIAVLAASAAVAVVDPFPGAQLGAGLVGAIALVAFAVLSVGGRNSVKA
ncbi:hypothetical protein SUDANB121_03521 [Nocardiopsis dassonvillei]|uniref:hypothetical protein n=1 Tax=Nocardiopsis dassonvillei TaxID=2014 RepID=UPI003F566605